MSNVSAVYQDANQLQSLVHNKNVGTAAKLKEVSIQFESIMMREYLKIAMAPMLKSHMGEAPAGSQFYEGILVDKMADSFSRTGQIGIADTFYNELKGLIPKSELEAEKAKKSSKQFQTISDDTAEDTVADSDNDGVYPGTQGKNDAETIHNLYQVWAGKGMLG